VILYILLGLLNGMVVSMSRTINGRLSMHVGPFRTSLANHVVGFLLLSLMLFLLGGWHFDSDQGPPVTAYLGGFFGALFVAVNSYVFPRIGAMNQALLVISGQMVFAVIIDHVTRDMNASMAQWLGVLIILSGVYLTRMSGATTTRRVSDDKIPIDS
jgi:bacterial/archaeal transporter family-2 protein